MKRKQRHNLKIMITSVVMLVSIMTMMGCKKLEKFIEIPPAVPTVQGVVSEQVYTEPVQINIAVPEALVSYTATIDGVPYALGTPYSEQGSHHLEVIATTIDQLQSSITFTFTIDIPEESASSTENDEASSSETQNGDSNSQEEADDSNSQEEAEESASSTENDEASSSETQNGDSNSQEEADDSNSQEEAENREVTFEDAGLEGAIRSSIGKSTGTLFQRDVEHLTNLDLPSRSIQSLQGIENLIGLMSLNLYDNQISDLSPLATLTALENLVLSNNLITSLQGLETLTHLHALYLEENDISDITELEGLINLKFLYLYQNNISNITALGGLTNLEYLHLSNNQIINLTGLETVTNLIDLSLGNNTIVDISNLDNLTRLEDLRLNDNDIEDISVVENFLRLKYLYITNNKVRDITSIARLSKLEKVHLYDNPLNPEAIQLIANAREASVEIYEDSIEMPTVNGLNEGDSFTDIDGFNITGSYGGTVLNLNGEPYVLGTPITEPGSHTIELILTRASDGRQARNVISFEVTETEGFRAFNFDAYSLDHVQFNIFQDGIESVSSLRPMKFNGVTMDLPSLGGHVTGDLYAIEFGRDAYFHAYLVTENSFIFLRSVDKSSVDLGRVVQGTVVFEQALFLRSGEDVDLPGYTFSYETDPVTQEALYVVEFRGGSTSMISKFNQNFDLIFTYTNTVSVEYRWERGNKIVRTDGFSTFDFDNFSTAVAAFDIEMLDSSYPSVDITPTIIENKTIHLSGRGEITGDIYGYDLGGFSDSYFLTFLVTDTHIYNVGTVRKEDVSAEETISVEQAFSFPKQLESGVVPGGQDGVLQYGTDPNSGEAVITWAVGLNNEITTTFNQNFELLSSNNAGLFIFTRK